MRGKVLEAELSEIEDGITPAYAGKSRRSPKSRPAI